MSGHGEFPTPEDIKKRREEDAQSAVTAALTAVEKMLMSGQEEMQVDWPPVVRAVVARKLELSGWTASFRHGDQREPGLYLKVVATPKGYRQSYPPGG